MAVYVKKKNAKKKNVFLLERKYTTNMQARW